MDPALFEQLANTIETNGEADPDTTALSSFFKYWWVCLLLILTKDVYSQTVAFRRGWAEFFRLLDY